MKKDLTLLRVEDGEVTDLVQHFVHLYQSGIDDLFVHLGIGWPVFIE